MRTTRMAAPPLAAGILLTALLAGCGPDAHTAAYPQEEHGAPAHSVGHEPAEEAGHETDDHGLPSGPVGEVDAFAVQGALGAVPSAEAVDVVGPGGEHFRVALRTPSIGHYPCTSCHVRAIGHKDEALAQMHGPREEHVGATPVDCDRCHDPARPGGMNLDCTECHEREGVRELMPSRTAHLTVKLSHPGGVYRNCLTCHAPENPGLLNLRNGGQATLDEAYRLCEGCHFMQASDWAAGSHGKRVAGWAGERTVLSCTGCHNPHDPAFPQRRPVTFPKIARPAEGR